MPPKRTIVREYFEALLIAVVFATFARAFVLQAFKIPTGSMEQNLLVGDHILVNKFIYAPSGSALESLLLPMRQVRRGDVVVFKFPDDPQRDFIKRCVAKGGDVLRLVDKELYVNGERVREPYVYHSDPRIYPDSVFLTPDFRDRDNFGPYVVPPGHLFFLGDNRDNSNDSRFWGPVPESYVKGRAFMVYWSVEGDEEIEASTQPAIEGPIDRLGSFFTKLFGRTRWGRSFRIVR